MATAVLRSHDALTNRMHLDAYTPSPAKPRRRRSPKPAAASSPPTRAPAPIAASSPPPKPTAAQKTATPAKAGPAAPGRRGSPPARPAAAASSRKQPSPTKDKPKQRLVMEEVRILKRGEEPPVPAPAPVPAPVVVPAPPVAQASVDHRAPRSTSRIGPQAPAVVPTKKMVAAAPAAANAAVYAGPAFSAAAPEPSSLPMPAFFLRRAESEATRGLRCLLRIGELA